MEVWKDLTTVFDFLCACLLLYQCDFSKYDEIQGFLIGAWWHKLLAPKLLKCLVDFVHVVVFNM